MKPGPGPGPGPAGPAEANRLYWQTDRSVADIADTLSVSRRALYELIEPERAGASCGNCGGDVVYINRSAKAANLGRCAQCGSENSVIDAEVAPLDEVVPPPAAGWPRAASEVEQTTRQRRRALSIGSTALAGAALGAIVVLLLVRRR